jgi:hypothetical protein
MAAMRRGDFLGAWDVSDRVLEQHVLNGACFDWPRHEQWVWDGRALAGKRVLVRCYHGLGDTIMFARYLPALASVASQVLVWAQPALIPLLATMQAPIEFLPLHDGTPEADFDVDVEIMELPHALRCSPRDLPSRVPYFSVPAAERPAEGLCVGLVAHAGDWDMRRDVPRDLIRSLREVPGVAAFNLQLQEPIDGVPDLSTSDVVRLAARVQAMHVVISVDTMVAHLAGALGVETWTLLRYEADWRWMMDRDDSPWYPSMRLLRQPRPDAWEPVVESARTLLASRAVG